jgi:cytochrome d ubiquinol oxidase subunit I
VFHKKAMMIGLWVGGIAAVLQPISGDLSAKHVARTQPVKLAAMEAQWETERGAPLRLLGWPDEETEQTLWAIEIPYLLSVLSFADPHAEVLGLKAFPKEDRPPVAIVHVAFQVMVACGVVMMITGLIGGWMAWRRKRLPDDVWYLKLVACCAPLGFVAVEAGWVVTEVGRQPWIIHGVMRTAEAVTPMPNLVIPFLVFTVLYIFLGGVVAVLLRRQVFVYPEEETHVST